MSEVASEPSVGSAILDLARRQGGVVTRQQALRLGATDKILWRLIRAGMLRRAHRGVFVLAGAPATHVTAVRAALAAVGPGSMASHRSAAWLQGLVDAPPAMVHVTRVATGGPSAGAFRRDRDRGGELPPIRRIPGIVVHRSGVPAPVRSFQGLPCSDVARTLVDLAGVAGPGETALAVDRALARGLTRFPDLLQQLVRGRQGTEALRRCLLERGDVAAPTASVLEAQMARLLHRHRLPVPRAEVRAGQGGRYRIDYAYAERRLALELFGYAWHHTPEQMAGDLARQRALVLAGWTVLAYSWRDVLQRESEVAAEVRAAYEGCADISGPG